MVEYREEAKKEDLSRISWYQTALSIHEDLIESDVLTLGSAYFEIISTASKGAIGKKVRATVERDINKLTVLSWKVEDE